MIKIFDKTLTLVEINKLIQRPEQDIFTKQELVKSIFLDIKKNGDEAIKKYTLQYDNIELKNQIITKQEISNANKKINKELKNAINIAYTNISKFHYSQKETPKHLKIMDGITCWRESRSIEKIGIYIPGGTAPLFSTVLMLAIPAKIAGCKEIIMTSPPDKNGNINDAILYAANLVGVTKIIKCGGIQAIAGLTFGTKTIPSVYKIFGPGNSFVTAAKLESLQHGISIDMPAGPSELMIIVDEKANPEWIAADTLAQLEHGADSQVIILCNDKTLTKKITQNINKQIETLPRKETIKKSILNSYIILEKNFKKQIEIINEYAPEHLILNVENYNKYIPEIKNSGSVFLGKYSAEAFGDYASGTNHTLPTNSFSKAYSGVSLDSFIKKITFQKIEKKGIKNLANVVEIMAENEFLQAHKNSVTIRK